MTVISENALIPAIPQDLEEIKGRRSWLLDYLPAMYAGDEFLNRFLLIFEDTLSPLRRMADDMHYYFNAGTVPEDLLPWLSTWIDLVLDSSWPIEKRRNLIMQAVELYGWRGTRRGLAEYIELYCGVEPFISEYVDGFALSPEARLGENTVIAGRERFSFTVTLRLPGLTPAEVASREVTIRRIIEAEKPAHTAYRLRILTNEEPSKESKAGKVVLPGPTPPNLPDPKDGPTSSNGGNGKPEARPGGQPQPVQPQVRPAQPPAGQQLPPQPGQPPRPAGSGPLPGVQPPRPPAPPPTGQQPPANPPKPTGEGPSAPRNEGEKQPEG